MRLLLCILISLVSLSVLADDVYRWTDENGDIHLSDKPHKGAEKVTLPKEEPHEPLPVERYTAPMNVMPISSANSSVTNAPDSYRLVAIIKPAPNQTIHHGELKVIVEVQPALNPEHHLELYLDEHKVAKSSGSLNFTLHNVDRGTHQLSVNVINSQGETLASSAPVVVHVHRPIIRRNMSQASLGMRIKHFFGIKSKA